MTVIDVNTLRQGPIPYLGWYLEGEASLSHGRAYRWYANEDGADSHFVVEVALRGFGGDGLSQWHQARELGLQVAKGKIFLRTWSQSITYPVRIAPKGRVPTLLLRNLILRGLHYLYEAGFPDGAYTVDLPGIAAELDVTDQIVERAVQYLHEQGLIKDNGTFGKNWSTGDFWLSTRGVQHVEQETQPVGLFLQELYAQTVARLGSIDPKLATRFESLLEAAGTPPHDQQEMVGFGAMARDFVQDLTAALYAGKGEPLPREQTIKKVHMLTQDAASETESDHVRALAEVVETHWRRLNKLQQKAVHAGSIEKQRLFAYTLLFVSDLLEVIGPPHR